MGLVIADADAETEKMLKIGLKWVLDGIVAARQPQPFERTGLAADALKNFTRRAKISEHCGLIQDEVTCILVSATAPDAWFILAVIRLGTAKSRGKMIGMCQCPCIYVGGIFHRWQPGAYRKEM